MAPPGGSWNDLKPVYSKIIFQLFKRQFLLKIRNVGSIVEFILSIAIFFIFVPIYIFGQIDNPEEKDPQLIFNQSLVSTDFGGFIAMGDPQTKLMIGPKSDYVTIVKGVFDGVVEEIIKVLNNNTNKAREYKQNSFDWVESTDKIREGIDGTGETALGLFLANYDDNNASYMLNPRWEVYYQTKFFAFDPSEDVDNVLRAAVGTANSFVYKSLAAAESDTDKRKLYEFLDNQSIKIRLANLSQINFATKKRVLKLDLEAAFSFFVVIPIIFATMPDFQTVLEDKDTHFAAYAFMNGCPESAYWIVQFIMPLVTSCISYLIINIIICFVFGMKGTNFLLVLILSFIFIVGHIWFQLFLTTFMKKGSTGRSVTIVFLVLIVFFAFLHQYFTLKENNTAESLKHIFSIIPFSCYEMFLMAAYNQVKNSLEPIGFSGNDKNIAYPLHYAVMWLCIDAVVYFLLFLLFNLILPRGFGSQPLPYYNFFKKEAWRQLFQPTRADEIVSDESKTLIHVEGLRKVYKGKKSIEALKGVDFDIGVGEVIVIIGPNGAGKSTLINSLSGAVLPTDVKCTILDGEETNNFKDLQKYVGVCYQENVIVRLLSVKEHLQLFGAFRGLEDEALNESIEYFGTQLQLTHMLDNRAGDLSGGQKRKLCIALSLLGNPPVVLMDEPTAGVDVQARRLIWKMISSLKNTTSIVSSHALEEAEAVCSRLFIVSAGTVPFCGTSTALRNEYKCGYFMRLETRDNNIQPIFEFVKNYVSDARLNDERDDTIELPVNDKIPQLLNDIDEKKEEFGIISYSFSVQQLEDMLLKLIQSQEVTQN